MSQYADIIERLEKATGPTLCLDILVENATDTATFKREPDTLHGDADHVRADVKPLTSSLDAAIALVERMLPGWGWAAGYTGKEFEGSLFQPDLDFDNIWPHEARSGSTVAIALLVAMFRALEAEAKP